MAGVGLEYKGVASISGPIIVVENVSNVGYDELVAVEIPNGGNKAGQSHSGNPESCHRASL